MLPIPADIFTGPSNVASDDLADLGPLRQLADVWRAYKGVDINPKAAGPYGKPRDVQHAPSKLITRVVAV